MTWPMDSVQVKRRLVKSPPELWAELSDAQALARRLGEFGEIRITRRQPETIVAWEGEHASGTIEIESSGWGTAVIITAQPAALPAGARAGRRGPGTAGAARTRAGAALARPATRRRRRPPADPEPPSPRPPAPGPPPAPEPGPQIEASRATRDLPVPPLPPRHRARGGDGARAAGPPRRAEPGGPAAAPRPRRSPSRPSRRARARRARAAAEPEPAARAEPEPLRSTRAGRPADAGGVGRRSRGPRGRLDDLGAAHHRPFSRG